MDDAGNIMVKRISKSNIYVKEVKTEENSISNDIIIAGGLLEIEKPVKVILTLEIMIVHMINLSFQYFNIVIHKPIKYFMASD